MPCKFYRILTDSGSPSLRGWWMGGWGWVGYRGVPCMHAHAHTCMLNMLNMDASMSAAIYNFFTCIHVCVCMWGHPPCPKTPPPTCPTPRATETQIRRITITLEQIAIIQFCLKIWDTWTLLHTYRLDLMCRWGVSYPKWHFYVFDLKKCSCDPPIKIIFCFCTGSH